MNQKKKNENKTTFNRIVLFTKYSLTPFLIIQIFYLFFCLALCNYVKMEDCSQDELYKCTKSVSIVSEMSNDIALRTKADLNRICP